MNRRRPAFLGEETFRKNCWLVFEIHIEIGHTFSNLLSYSIFLACLRCLSKGRSSSWGKVNGSVDARRRFSSCFSSFPQEKKFSIHSTPFNVVYFLRKIFLNSTNQHFSKKANEEFSRHHSRFSFF